MRNAIGFGIQSTRCGEITKRNDTPHDGTAITAAHLDQRTPEEPLANAVDLISPG